MTIDSTFMHRCLQLARKGEGFAMPNPMVGAVIVHNGKIIGEGFHRQFGQPHAEVNAFHSVKDESLLPESTMYVSLEPCSHYGKTPPCAELIVAKKIPRVVIATTDPNPEVAGRGIEILEKNGLEVTAGVLQEQARELNRVFFVNQLHKRPYIILKWAESKDGFMDRLRTSRDKAPAKLSNTLTQNVVHKLRTTVQGIMVGTNTALLDNPHLTARKWFGTNPTRIVVDRKGKIPTNSAIFNGEAPTIVFTECAPSRWSENSTIKFIKIDFKKDTNLQIINKLYEEKIHSVLIEGGAALLTSFIDAEMWDEAYIETSQKTLFSGVKSPEIQRTSGNAKKYLDSIQFHLKNKITRNFL